MIAFILMFTLLINQFNYVPDTVLDDMDIVVNKAEKSLGFTEFISQDKLL